MIEGVNMKQGTLSNHFCCQAVQYGLAFETVMSVYSNRSRFVLLRCWSLVAFVKNGYKVDEIAFFF